MKPLPDPSDMLEELADKVISHISRLAVTSFENALSEMIDFHRFLIDAYETQDEDGKFISFAQIGDFGPLHSTWIRQYHRMFERAVENIGRESEFIEILVYLPLRLLPKDARNTSPEVTAALLDISNILVHRLEAWLTNQRMQDQTKKINEKAMGRLAGSDKHAYEEVIIQFVGAWESTLQTVSHIYVWNHKEVGHDEQWKRYSVSWPFLQRHLRNSAYLLAVAVWNEDEIGANYYSEVLLRWFYGISHEFNEDDYHSRPLLTPDLLDLTWAQVQVVIQTQPATQTWRNKPSPKVIFSDILRNVLSDVITLVLGVILDWYINKRQESSTVPNVLSRFFNNTVSDDTYGTAWVAEFQPLIFGFIRMNAAGDRFERRGYSYWLDQLVSLIDSMTERRVVPGRAYTPSTHSDRADLRLPWLVCLLTSLPSAGDNGSIQALTRLIEDEEIFTRNDEVLRRILYELDLARTGLGSENQEYLTRGFSSIRPDKDLDESISRLITILEKMKEVIGSWRDARLRKLPVSSKKISEIREAIEAVLMSNSRIGVFSGFRIFREHKPFDDQFCMTWIKKGYLTDPEMENIPSNTWEMVIQKVQQCFESYVWRDFHARPRRTLLTENKASYRAALLRIANRMLKSGHQPVLLVSRHHPIWIREWLGWDESLRDGLQLTRRHESKANNYAGTLNNIDVYWSNHKTAESLLFRGDLLKEVCYGTNQENHLVEVTYKEQEVEGLVIGFSLTTKWYKNLIFVLSYPAHGDSIER